VGKTGMLVGNKDGEDVGDGGEVGEGEDVGVLEVGRSVRGVG